MPYCPTETAEIKAATINAAMVAFGIDQTPQREAMYIANVALETGELHYVREIADGSAYEMNLRLGNDQPGDGLKYPGRGDLQNTGKGNYAACSLALYGDDRLLHNPELLERPTDGSNAGAWFWQSHGLNIVADAGDFETVCATINGRNRQTGMPNHYDQRLIYWGRAKQVKRIV